MAGKNLGSSKARAKSQLAMTYRDHAHGLNGTDISTKDFESTQIHGHNAYAVICKGDTSAES